jgi:hypothetical protein
MSSPENRLGPRIQLLRQRYGKKLQRAVAVAIAYVTVVLFLAQIVSLVSALGLPMPLSLGPVVLVLLVGGLALAVVAAWNQEDSSKGYSAAALGAVAVVSVAMAYGLFAVTSRIAAAEVEPPGSGDASSPHVSASPDPDAVRQRIDALSRTYGERDEVVPWSAGPTPSVWFADHATPVRANLASVSRGQFLRALLDNREIGRTETLGPGAAVVSGAFEIPSDCGGLPYVMELRRAAGEFLAEASLDRERLRTRLERWDEPC